MCRHTLANLLHVRGDPAVFDAWAAEEGCDGWGYLDMGRVVCSFA